MKFCHSFASNVGTPPLPNSDIVILVLMLAPETQGGAAAVDSLLVDQKDAHPSFWIEPRAVCPFLSLAGVLERGPHQSVPSSVCFGTAKLDGGREMDGIYLSKAEDATDGRRSAECLG